MDNTSRAAGVGWKPRTEAAQQLRELVPSLVRVEDLLSEPFFVVPRSESAAAARAVMEARGFDVVGVDSAGDGNPDGIVRLSDLVEGDSVGQVCRPLLARDAIEKSTSVFRLLELLADRSEVFVMDGEGVGYILTHADLAKPAVNLAAFGSLLSLEHALQPLACARFGSRWFEALPAKSLRAAETIYERNRRRHSDLGLEDCLFFDHTLDLAARAPGLLADLGWTGQAFEHLRKHVNPMRNRLAHGRNLIKGPPGRSIKILLDARRLTEAALGLSEAQPPIWETNADSVIEASGGALLAGPGAVVWPFGRSACVLTAWNPASRTRPDHVNNEAQESLLHELVGSFGDVHPVVGKSPDGKWSEPSLLVEGMERSAAAEIAARYGQAAFFRIDARIVEVGAAGDGATLFVQAPGALTLRQAPRSAFHESADQGWVVRPGGNRPTPTHLTDVPGVGLGEDHRRLRRPPRRSRAGRGARRMAGPRPAQPIRGIDGQALPSGRIDSSPPHPAASRRRVKSKARHSAGRNPAGRGCPEIASIERLR